MMRPHRRPPFFPTPPLSGLGVAPAVVRDPAVRAEQVRPIHEPVHLDRKSTRLNSSHLVISYAVFCLKKKTTAKQLQSSRRGFLFALVDTPGGRVVPSGATRR